MKLPPDYVDLEVREMVKKLPGPKQLGDKGLTVPLNIFLYQEIARMQRIIGIGSKTLMDVIDAIDGQIIMTPDILDAINAMFDAKVPNAWVYDATGVEISWILPTLGAWFGSLIDRNKQLNDWLKNNRPQAYWLTGFFNPQGFLTAMKQEVTRMHKARPGDKVQESWSLDDVTYSTQVKEREYENIKDIQ
jgi:dynein heavy chain